MPTLAPTWTYSTERLAVFLPPLVRRVNKTFGTDYAVPTTVAQIEAFLHDAVILWAKMEATREHVDGTIEDVRIDLRNEIAAAFTEG